MDMEKIKKVMTNKKAVTVLAVAMLAMGIAMAFFASMVGNWGNTWLADILNLWAQVFVVAFVLLFAYMLFALDKELTAKLEAKKKKKEEKEDDKTSD